MKKSLIVWVALPLGLAACETYQPAPLAPSEHLAAWRDRSPLDEAVGRYAESLAEADPAHPPRTVDPNDGISLAEAELLTLVFNPHLRLARLEAKIPVLGAEKAGLWEDPVVSFDALKIAESVPKPWTLGSSIAFTIPISGRLEVAQSKAHAEGNVEVRRAHRQEWDTLHALRQAWIAWSALERRYTLAESYRADLSHVRDIAVQQAKAQLISVTDSRVFEIEAVRLVSEMLKLRSEAQSQRLTVLRLMGFGPQAELTLTPALPTPIVNNRDPDAAVERHPSVRVARAEYEVAEHALHFEIRKQYPDLQIGPGYEHEGGLNKAGVVLEVPIPLFNGNIRAITEARAERDARRGAYEAQLETVLQETLDARLRYETSRYRHEHTLQRFVPLADQQLLDLRTQATLGRFDTMTMLEGLQTSRAAKLTVLETTEAQARAATHLQALIQAPPATPVLNDLNKDPQDDE